MQASPAVARNLEARTASTRPEPAASETPPGFIGPVGYDVER